MRAHHDKPCPAFIGQACDLARGGAQRNVEGVWGVLSRESCEAATHIRSPFRIERVEGEGARAEAGVWSEVADDMDRLDGCAVQGGLPLTESECGSAERREVHRDEDGCLGGGGVGGDTVWHRENRAGRRCDARLRHAAHEEPVWTRTPVRAQNQEVSLDRCGVAQERGYDGRAADYSEADAPDSLGAECCRDEGRQLSVASLESAARVGVDGVEHGAGSRGERGGADESGLGAGGEIEGDGDRAEGRHACIGRVRKETGARGRRPRAGGRDPPCGGAPYSDGGVRSRGRFAVS